MLFLLPAAPRHPAINSAEPPPGLGNMGLKHLHSACPDRDQLLRTAVLTCCAEGLGTDGRLQLVDLLPLVASAIGDVRACLAALELWVEPLTSRVPRSSNSSVAADVSCAPHTSTGSVAVVLAGQQSRPNCNNTGKQVVSSQEGTWAPCKRLNRRRNPLVTMRGCKQGNTMQRQWYQLPAWRWS
jgi:hypothetical protein